MFAFAALTYGVIASFVMASVHRNRREARGHPPLLLGFGWLLMAFSGTFGLALLGLAGYHALSGTPVAI
jgi:drug/metabolite transporter (DMT)-like permease